MSKIMTNYLTPIIREKIKQPKCECGATCDLSFHDDRWWCSLCLWAKIQQLRKLLGELAREYKRTEEYAGGVANASLTYQEATNEAGEE